jgi:cytoskeleton protein RodZ
MSDEKDKTEETVTNDESEGPVGGERLAEARRKLQITVIDIAKELHLDEFKVRALECNDFDVLGAPVFAKGHLKKYAQLVKVDEADVMADYYQLERASGTQPVVPRRSRPRQTISLGPWVAAIVVIAIAASGYWWFTSRETPPARPVTGVIAPLPQEADSVAEEVEDTELPDQTVAIEPEVVAESESESESEPEPEPEPEPVALPLVDTDEFGLTLSITYSGDCWTEITDASGRRLFFDLGKAGRTVDLTGEAPFNVLFGDADNVSLVVDGASFDIAARDRRGQTARLTITGS